MGLDYNITNILILFGALQGLVLCLFLYQKRKINPPSVYFFILFLFSLAFFNLNYALIDMDVFEYYRPLHLFPWPYKWLIGPAFYFYVKHQFKTSPPTAYHRKEYSLFIPAICFGLLQTYWFYIAISENSWRIMRVVIDSNFYRVAEIAYLLFNLVLAVAVLKFIKQHHHQLAKPKSQGRALNWASVFTSVFLLKTLADLIIIVIDLSLHAGKESWLFYAVTLVLNSAYIYWIGYIGFTRPKLFANAFKLKGEPKEGTQKQAIKKKLASAMQEEVYTNPDLTLARLALQLQLPAKELSTYINEVHQQNFSEFLSHHRIEKVKILLLSPEAQQYTLVTLAKEAGFNSKSSFNATFKKIVGLTPSAYQKQQQNH